MSEFTQSQFDSEEYAWKDLSIVFGGRPVTKFRGFKYKISKEAEALYASGEDPHSVQSGNKSYTGEFKFLQSEIHAMNATAKALGKNDLTDLTLSAIVHFSREITDAQESHEVRNFKITEYELGMEQGDKNSEISLPWIAQKIVPNI